MVIGRATDVVVVLGQGRFGLLGQGSPVEAVAEDGFDTLVAVAAQGEGASAGGLQPVLAVGVTQAQNAQTAAVGLLGVLSGRQPVADQPRGGRADACGPAFQALRGPLAGLAVCLGHVGGDGGMASLVVGTPMAGDASAAVEAFNGVGGAAHVHLFFDERMGHGVVMALDLDVVVDMDPRLFPLGVFVGLDRQGAQRRLVQLLKQGAPAARQFPEGAVVERLKQGPDGAVQLGQGEALTVAQRSQDPALHHLDPDLGLRFLISHQMLVVRMTVQPESLRLPTRSTQSGGSNLP